MVMSRDQNAGQIIQRVRIDNSTFERVEEFKYLGTYLLTPWYRVLLEKLTGLQLVKKFP